MDIDELDFFLEKNREDISWCFEKKKGTLYLHLRSEQWDEIIKIDLQKLPKLTPEKIKSKLRGGKNITQVTRVTGYFSNVAQWNPGKKGELTKRYRIYNSFKSAGAAFNLIGGKSPSKTCDS